jgi:hypothetical protein
MMPVDRPLFWGEEKGLTKCTVNEFVQSCFQDSFLGVLYIKKCTIHIFVCLFEIFLYQLYRFPPTWHQGGFPFLDLELFSFSMQALFPTNSFAKFV